MRWKRADAIASALGAPPGQTVWFCGHGNADEIAPGRGQPPNPSIASRVSIGPCRPPGRSPVRGLARRICAPIGQLSPSGSMSKVKPFHAESLASMPGIARMRRSCRGCPSSRRPTMASARSSEETRARGFLRHPRPEPAHILLKLPVDEICSVEPEIAPSAAFPRFGQKMRVLRPGRDERTLGEKAVFIAMAEQQFTKRNLVRIIAIGRRSGLARAIPVERWLRDAVSETEGLDVVHVGRKERRERREAGEVNARLNGFFVSRRSFQRPRPGGDKGGRLPVAQPPLPAVR